MSSRGGHACRAPGAAPGQALSCAHCFGMRTSTLGLVQSAVLGEYKHKLEEWGARLQLGAQLRGGPGGQRGLRRVARAGLHLQAQRAAVARLEPPGRAQAAQAALARTARRALSLASVSPCATIDDHRCWLCWAARAYSSQLGCPGCCWRAHLRSARPRNTAGANQRRHYATPDHTAAPPLRSSGVIRNRTVCTLSIREGWRVCVGVK